MFAGLTWGNLLEDMSGEGLGDSFCLDFRGLLAEGVEFRGRGQFGIHAGAFGRVNVHAHSLKSLDGHPDGDSVPAEFYCHLIPFPRVPCAARILIYS